MLIHLLVQVSQESFSFSLSLYSQKFYQVPAVFANLVVVIQSKAMPVILKISDGNFLEDFVRALSERDADDVAVADQIRALLAMLYAPGLDEILDGCSPLETRGGRFSVGYLE